MEPTRVADLEQMLGELLKTCSGRLRSLLGGEEPHPSAGYPTARRYGTLHETHSITLRTEADHPPPPMS